jgi:NTP pyrophosphatase (non-canonical NTP hydrolase)
MQNPEINRYILEQNEKRALWGEYDTPDKLAQMLVEESKELFQAIQEAYITGDVFSVASEIGDLRYLLEKLADMVGIDTAEAAEMKIWRNSEKFPDHLMSNGRGIKEAVALCRVLWESKGGDATWSHSYLDYLAQD